VTRRRRAALLLGLALLLGGLAASDVARREAAVRAELAPLVDIVVARRDLAAHRRLRPADLAIRRLPARYAPVGAAVSPAEVLGQRLAISVPGGGVLATAQLERSGALPGPSVRRGERAAEVVAAGSPELVAPGARVDVLVTREARGGAAGATELALQDVEVLSAGPAPPQDGPRGEAGARVAASLRVTIAQAVYLTAAQTFARELRLLPRAPGDRRRAAPLRVGEELR